jgi:hypothetical protein
LHAAVYVASWSRARKIVITILRFSALLHRGTS